MSFLWLLSYSRGQLGNGSLNVAENPELLAFLDGLIVVDIDAGGWHSAALTNCGDLYTWGWNNFGQLGFTCDKSEKYWPSLMKFVPGSNSDLHILHYF